MQLLNFDVHCGLDWESLNGTLTTMRNALKNNRQGQYQYQIRVNTETPLYIDNKVEVTQAGDVFTITLDRRTLYPVGFVNGQPYNVVRTRNGVDQQVQLIARVYDPSYYLNDILGIIVAEQLRFNTFEQINNYIFGSRNYFYVLASFLESYKNYSKGGPYHKGVQVLLPYIDQ